MHRLYNYCCWLDCEKTTELLEQYPNEIDLTYNEGRMFRLAISGESSELVNILLSFYKETQLKGDIESVEYKKANYMLRNILQEAEESFEITPEIYKVIEPYLSTEESDKEQDLSGFDIDYDYDTQDISYTIQKSNSAPELLVHQKMTVRLLHTSSESFVSSSRDSADGDMPHQHSIDLVGQDFVNLES